MRFAPVARFAYRVARDKQALLILTRQQHARIAELERANGEAWSLAMDLTLDLQELWAERDLLLERCPTDAHEIYDQGAG